MKKILLSAAAFAVVVVSAVAVAPTTSEAVPAFARQTGAACLSCHFQAIPRLTAMGRNFSLTGMRDMGEQGLIEDDVLSLPAQFNAGFLMKVLVRNKKGLIDNSATATDNTGIMIPDESAIFIGGRYGEHVGGLTEVSTNNGGGVAQAKLNYVIDTDAGHVSIAMVSGDVGLGVLFSDPSNTVRHTNRAAVSRALALENTDMMNSGVTGFQVSSLIADSIYVAGAVYANASPGELTGEWGSLSGLSTYLRGAYIAELAGLEAIVGAFYISTKPSSFTGAAAVQVTDAAGANIAGNFVSQAGGGQNGNVAAATQYGIDLQLQGDLGDMSLGFYLPIVLKGEQQGGAAITENVTGAQAMATLAFGHTGVKLGYDTMTTKAVGTNTAAKIKKAGPYLGAWYSLAQNVELELAYTSHKTTGNATAAKNGTVNTTTLVIEYVY